LLVKDQPNEDDIQTRLVNLPLIIEGFFELKLIKFKKFNNLENLLGFKFIGQRTCPFD
jgi:hypothetical protein